MCGQEVPDDRALSAVPAAPVPGPPQYPPPSPSQQPTLRCPLCGGEEFQREESRQDSRWGFTAHRMTLMICQRCRYVLPFYDEHSIFNFD